MSYKVIIDGVSDELWEQYAINFADYNLYQTPAYQRVRAENDGQELSRAVVLDDCGEVMTMCHMRIKHIKPVGLRVGYVQWGPLLRLKNGHTRREPEVFKELLNCYLGPRVNVLRIAPNICDDDFGKQVCRVLESAGFGLVRTVSPYLTMIIPLEGGEDKIRSRFHRSWRRGLNKAENNNMSIREGTDRELLKILDRIYTSARSRKGFKGLDPDVFIRTQELLPDTSKMNTVVAFADKEPLTAHSTSHLGDTALGILAGSSEKGLEFGSSYLVWWHTLLAARRAGMLKYDLGGIDPVDNPAVHQFKMRMGAEQVRYIGVFDICTGVIAKEFWHMIDRIYRMITKKG
jgi:hypothetical protein